MRDCENEVYTRVEQHLNDLFDDAVDMSGVYVPAPTSFPHVYFHEADNYVDERQTSDTEEMAVIVFEAEVYSNKTAGKKQECKTILNAIDDVMFSLNARRLSKLPLPNMQNATICRYVARYRLKYDGKLFYRG